MMKIECKNCTNIYNAERGACPECGTTGGFMQNPSLVIINGVTYHLKALIKHKASNNIYQIKEVQTNGFLAFLHDSPIALERAKKGLKVYIGNASLDQYEVM